MVLSDIVERIRAESEVPDLRVAASQPPRLWTLDRPECGHPLHGLAEDGFLASTGESPLTRVDRTSARRAATTPPAKPVAR